MISFARDESHATYQIKSYDDNHIQVNQQCLDNSFIITAENIITHWTNSTIDKLQEIDLKRIIKMEINIIILATREYPTKQLAPELLIYLNKQKIGCEIMSIGAACRTYTILASERRLVAGAFLL